ncbi:hypothetical protein ACJX0J_012095, partial [Zea mays]
PYRLARSLVSSISRYILFLVYLAMIQQEHYRLSFFSFLLSAQIDNDKNLLGDILGNSTLVLNQYYINGYCKYSEMIKLAWEESVHGDSLALSLHHFALIILILGLGHEKHDPLIFVTQIAKGGR